MELILSFFVVATAILQIGFLDYYTTVLFYPAIFRGWYQHQDEDIKGETETSLYILTVYLFFKCVFIVVNKLMQMRGINSAETTKANRILITFQYISKELNP